MLSSLSRLFRRRPRTTPQKICKLRVEELEDRAVPSAGWAVGVSGTSWVGNWGLAVDAQQNSYVAGEVIGTADFDPGPGVANLSSVPSGTADGYVAKYNPAGALVWARSFGGTTGAESAHRVVVDASGCAYISGIFDTSASFGPFTLTSAGGVDAFVAKLDAAGNFVWAESFGGIGDDGGWGLALDANGNVYAGGYFVGTGAFGAAGSLTGAGGQDAFLVKLDATSGSAQWVRRMGGAQDWDWLSGITTDRTGNVYATGRFQAIADFGGTTLTSKGGTDIFLTRLDADGNFEWAPAHGRGFNQYYQ